MPGEVATDGSGSLAQTADGRYRRALYLCLADAPKDAAAALTILADEKVRMDMTVQQMVFRAATGEIVVRDPKERSFSA